MSIAIRCIIAAVALIVITMGPLFAARILQVIPYLTNVDKLRSLVWTAGMVCCFWLMALAV